MSYEPKTAPATPIENRRGHLRRKVDSLAYVACGSDNGGILLDVGEGGLSFQGIAALTDGNILEIKFTLPGFSNAIETTGEVVWSTDSRRGGGVRFVNLGGSAREQIKHWVSGSVAPLNQKAPSPASPPSAAPVVLPEPPPLATEGLFVIPATPASESALTRGQDSAPAHSPRTMFTDGLRRIHPVAAASQPAPREEPWVNVPSPVEPTESQGVVLTGVPDETFRSTLYLLGALVGFVIIIAGGLIAFRARAGSGAAGGQGTAVSQASADGASRNFQVEVLDIHNRRLVLSNDTSSASSGSGASPGQRGASQNFSGGNVTKPFAASSPAGVGDANRRNLQDLTLKTPSQLNRAPAEQQSQAPALAGVVPPAASLGAPFVVNESQSQPAPPQAAAASAVPKSGLQPAVLIKRVEPAYSAVARQARASGVVQVRATIGTDGVPTALRFVSGDSRLAAPALQAIRLWRYRPALLDGQAIETEALIQVEFRLQ